MYFITAAAMAVGGERLGEAFKDDIQGPDRDAVQGKADVQVCVKCFQKDSFFLCRKIYEFMQVISGQFLVIKNETIQTEHGVVRGTSMESLS